MTALERDPDHRYQDAAEMYRDLDRVLHERQPPTANELTRFLELLFDEEERSDAPPPGTADADEAPQGGRVRAPGATWRRLSRRPPPPPIPARSSDPLSIQKLLKRFGIK